MPLSKQATPLSKKNVIDFKKIKEAGTKSRMGGFSVDKHRIFTSLNNSLVLDFM